MIWVGGGAGMAPLRAQIMHMTKTLHTTDLSLIHIWLLAGTFHAFAGMIFLIIRTVAVETIDRLYVVHRPMGILLPVVSVSYTHLISKSIIPPARYHPQLLIVFLFPAAKKTSMQWR